MLKFQTILFQLKNLVENLEKILYIDRIALLMVVFSICIELPV